MHAVSTAGNMIRNNRQFNKLARQSGGDLNHASFLVCPLRSPPLPNCSHNQCVPCRTVLRDIIKPSQRPTLSDHSHGGRISTVTCVAHGGQHLSGTEHAPRAMLTCYRERLRPFAATKESGLHPNCLLFLRRSCPLSNGEPLPATFPHAPGH